MNISTTPNAQAISALAVSNAAPAAAVTPATQARVFDLTGTSITMTECTTHDYYTGPLAELLAVGLVREDQLPPQGSNAISWLRGERMGRGRVGTDETYLKVLIRPKNSSVAVGLPTAIQLERRRAWQAKDAAMHEGWRAKRRQAERAAQAVAFENAVQSLANVPRSREAYLRREAQGARRVLLAMVEIAAEGSSCHGYRMDRDSLEEIYSRVDAVIEAFLNASVEFDAQRQAEVIAERQRKVLEADPDLQARVKTLVSLNPAVLQGEAA